MILLSVGTQFPFDRLVRTVDDWAFRTGRADVVGQVGPSSYVTKAVKVFAFLGPDEFRDLQSASTVMISHAGMGSILTALEYGKPIIIMPRDHTRGEHRNGHQMATADRFRNIPGVHVAADEVDLLDYLDRLDALVGARGGSAKAPPAFTDRLRDFIAEEKVRR